MAILQPFGRSRPSALAVHRAMSKLGLLDGDDARSDEIRPVAILSAMRKWKKRAAFESSSSFKSNFSTSLVPVVDNNMTEDENGAV